MVFLLLLWFCITYIYWLDREMHVGFSIGTGRHVMSQRAVMYKHYTICKLV